MYLIEVGKFDPKYDYYTIGTPCAILFVAILALGTEEMLNTKYRYIAGLSLLCSIPCYVMNGVITKTIFNLLVEQYGKESHFYNSFFLDFACLRPSTSTSSIAFYSILFLPIGLITLWIFGKFTKKSANIKAVQKIMTFFYIIFLLMYFVAIAGSGVVFRKLRFGFYF